MSCFVWNFKLFGWELCSPHKMELKNSQKKVLKKFKILVFDIFVTSSYLWYWIFFLNFLLVYFISFPKIYSYMNFIDIFCMPFWIIWSISFLSQKSPNLWNFFNFFVFRFLPIKTKVLMINYFCKKKLKANIVEMFCM